MPLLRQTLEKRAERKQDVKNFHPYHSVFIARQTPCAIKLVFVSIMSVLPSPRTCIPETPADLSVSAGQRPHPALSCGHTHEAWKSVRSIC